MNTNSTYRIAQHAAPNQEHRFQYDLALLAGGSATVSVQQLVGSTYQNLPSTQTQSSSGTYTLAFAPTEESIRIVVASANRFAFTNLTLDRNYVDTLLESNALHAGGYRYGFNGMEKDDEVKCRGNSFTTEFRLYDARLGRWLTLDPLMAKFPWQSPYVAFDNNPIVHNDPKGLAAESQTGGSTKGSKRKKKLSDRISKADIQGKFDKADKLRARLQDLNESSKGQFKENSGGTIPRANYGRGQQFTSHNGTTGNDSPPPAPALDKPIPFSSSTTSIRDIVKSKPMIEFLKPYVKYAKSNPGSTIYIYGGSPSPGEPDTSVENADKLNKALKLAGLHRSTKVTIVPYIPGVPAPSESLHPTFPTLWIVD